MGFSSKDLTAIDLFVKIDVSDLLFEKENILNF
jgi:hypothetical protein